MNRAVPARDGDLERDGDGVALSDDLAHGLAVLRMFDAAGPRLTVQDVAARSGLPEHVALRSLSTLTALGYVRRDDDRYAPTPRVLGLGLGYLSTLPLADIAQPHVDVLSRAVTQSSSVAVLDGGEIVYVARALSRRIRTVSIVTGSRFPAWATSMGRVLLASLSPEHRASILDGVELVALTPRTIIDRDRLDGELDRVARQGWALLDGELELGSRSLAAPLHDGTGAVVGAVNVAMSPLDEPDRLLVPLLAAARAIDEDLRVR